jgi:hypothetical protein
MQRLLGVHELEHVVTSLVTQIGSRREPATVNDNVGAGDVRRLVAGQNSAVEPISSAFRLRHRRTVVFMAFFCTLLMTGFELIEAVRSVSIHPG